MTKEIIEKMSTPSTPLSISDISVEEKKSLSDFLCEKGFTPSTFYLRFFQKGFDAWELQGIKDCQKHFSSLPDIAQLLKEYVETDALGKEIGKKGYLLEVAPDAEPSVFYACLKKAQSGLCSRFTDYMEQRGMSRNTVYRRFSEDGGWKPWEVVGIKALLHEFMESQVEKAAS